MRERRGFIKKPIIIITLAALTASVFNFTALVQTVNAAPLSIVRANVDDSGNEADAGTSYARISTSLDGRYLAYSSPATNLVASDTNGVADIFVYDRVDETVERISVSAAGVQANGASTYPSISADGRYVVYQSDATNIVSGDTNSRTDIFYRDRALNTTFLVSRATGQSGTIGNDHSTQPIISPNGLIISFSSLATNLVASDTNAVRDVFVRTSTFGTTRVSVATGGTQGNAASYTPALSYDGRYVAYRSEATNLVAGDTNAKLDIFVRDRTGAITERVSLATGGTQGDGDSYDPVLSWDGRYVGYEADATNLVASDTNAKWDVFVYDRTNDTNERVSLTEGGAQSNGDSYAYWEQYMSWDGRYIAFESDGTNMVSGYGAGYRVYVYDRTDDTLDIVGTQVDGTDPNDSAYGAVISPSGEYVAFTSNATNLVAGDTNGVEDQFIVQFIDNTAPDDPTGMNHDSGATISDNTPTFNFTTSDPDVSDTVRFRIQIDESSNFYDAEVDYTSDFAATGITSFTVGQAAGNGTYVDGTAGQTLPDEQYFWRVMVIDDNLAESEWVRATLLDDGYAFIIDAVANTTYSSDVNRITEVTGRMPGNGSFSSSQARISGDGQFVVFGSDSEELVPNDTNEWHDTFVYDTSTGDIELITISNDGYQQNDDSFNPHISADGRYVTFWSWATNLTDGVDYNDDNADVFVYDRDLDVMEMVHISDSGMQGNGSALNPTISGDGRYVAFSSNSDNLVANDTNSREDIFVYDRQTDTIELVSKTDAGVLGNNNSTYTYISANGRYVTFESTATNLVASDTNANRDVFVFDRNTDTIERVSISDAEAQSTGGGSGLPYITNDGRYVTFESDATNLIVGDTNGFKDIFLRDRTSGTTERVSIVDGGVGQPNNLSGVSLEGIASITDDGRYVSFESRATNLVTGDTNNDDDNFLLDRNTSDVIRISTYDDGTEGEDDSFESIISADGHYIAFTTYSEFAFSDTNTDADVMVYDVTGVEDLALASGVDKTAGGWDDSLSYHSGASDDGRYVLFSSTANNLVQGDTNFFRDMFVYDANLDVIERVSISSAGVQGNGISWEGAISADGRYVAFDSDAGNLVAGDTNATGDVFVYDRDTDTLERISVSSLGVEGNNWSYEPSISDDGRYVSFYSNASNLVSGDTNGMSDIFVYDRQTDTIERVSVANGGVEAGGADGSYINFISGDGRYVAFESAFTNLVAGDTNGTYDIFVYDRDTDTIERVSVADGAVQATGGDSNHPTISDDGRYVMFQSTATNLVAGDSNAVSDIFVYDRQTDTIERISVTDAGVQGNAASETRGPGISDDGRYVTFWSTATNLVTGDSNALGDIFLYDRTNDDQQRVTDLVGVTQSTGGLSQMPTISPNGAFIFYQSAATNLVANDIEGQIDLFSARVLTNSNPDNPTSLGPTSLVDGSWGTDNTPTFTFDLSDDNGSDTVQYQIQIDNNSSFASPAIDYTSALGAQGSFSFTVGQAVGGGTYAVGSSGQTLSDDDYYWQVKAIDVWGDDSSFEEANGGAVAFGIDTIAPTAGTANVSVINTTSLTVSIGGASDAGSGLATTPYLFRNITNSTNSGQQSATTWDSTSLTSSTSYTFDVVVSDLAGNTATTSTVTETTLSTGGGGGGGSTSSGSVAKPKNNLAPVGVLDEIRPDGIIRGWAYDPSNSSASVTIHIYVGGPAGKGTLVTGLVTDIVRTDVNSAYGITGAHGFEFELPTKYKGNNQIVYVYAIDLTDSKQSVNLVGSPKNSKSGQTPPPPPAPVTPVPVVPPVPQPIPPPPVPQPTPQPNPPGNKPVIPPGQVNKPADPPGQVKKNPPPPAPIIPCTDQDKENIKRLINQSYVDAKKLIIEQFHKDMRAAQDEFDASKKDNKNNKDEKSKKDKENKANDKFESSKKAAVEKKNLAFKNAKLAKDAADIKVEKDCNLPFPIPDPNPGNQHPVTPPPVIPPAPVTPTPQPTPAPTPVPVQVPPPPPVQPPMTPVVPPPPTPMTPVPPPPAQPVTPPPPVTPTPITPPPAVTPQPTPPGVQPSPQPVTPPTTPGQVNPPTPIPGIGETPSGETPSTTQDGQPTTQPDVPYVIGSYYDGFDNQGSGNVLTDTWNYIDEKVFDASSGVSVSYLTNIDPNTQSTLAVPNRALSKIPNAQAIVTTLNPIYTIGFIPFVSLAYPSLSAASSVGTFYDFWLIMFRSLNSLLGLVGLKRRKHYWGTVYDTTTKQPIDPVVVRLIDADSGKVLEEAITDLWGRFGFLKNSGKFMIKPERSHYQFPSTKVSRPRDQIYENLYFGEVFSVQSAASMIAPNIPMDPTEYDFNQIAKLKLIKFHPKAQWLGMLFLDFLFWAGFAYSIFAFMAQPILFNAFMILIYFALSFFYVFKVHHRLWGRVTDKHHKPITNVKIEVSPVQFADVVVVAHVTPDPKTGKFFLKVAPGNYVMKVKQGDQILSRMNVTVGKKGIFTKNIIV